jgi:hypothetical protein
MVTLVHLTPAKLEPKLRRSGLPIGAFAFPVLPNYTLSHQWTREIAKWRRQPLIGVYFRIADDALVRFGHYFREHLEARASAAVAAIRAEADPRGFELVLLSLVKPSAITRTSPVRTVVGWRHMPDAHKRPLCGCPGCISRGEPGGRRIRERYERGEI